MKIFEVIPKLITGGAEKFVVHLSNDFYSKGHDVWLITLFDSDKDCIFESLLYKGLKRVCLHKKSGIDFRCMIALYKFIRDEHPDVVHIHVGAIKYILPVLLLLKRVSFVTTIHSEPRYDAFSKCRVLLRKLLFSFKRMTPIVISNCFSATFKEMYNRTPVVIFNGSDLYKGYASEEIQKYRNDVDFLFIHAARIHTVKNQLMLMRVFSRLIDEGYKVRLLLFGRQEDVDIFRLMSASFSDSIVYMGETKDVRPYMKGADAFCLTSLVEGMPISIIEAMSVGCVPIVTPAGGCKEIIENEVDGLITADFDESSYYNALLSFMECDTNTRTRMSHSSIQTFISKYSMSICSENYLSLFNRILDE